MAKRPRRNHGSAFKAKVGLEAIKGDQILVELSERFQVHPNQITEWKKQLLERAEEIFAKDKKSEPGPSVKELHAKIGQLIMENDFLSIALGRIAEPSAKNGYYTNFEDKTESITINAALLFTEIKENIKILYRRF